jgi:phosphate transport system permease protein
VRKQEAVVKVWLAIASIVALVAVFLILIYVVKSGYPVLAKYGLTSFILGTKWDPLAGQFGILPMIVGSAFVTLGALVIGLPIGMGGAIFMAEFAPERIVKFFRPLVDLLAGIPSVVFGFYGLIVIVPFMRERFGGNGFSLLAGALILAIMILPTIIKVVENSLRAVPRDYVEGSLALGATKWQTVTGVMIPAARSGIIAAIILGIGRAVGETMAVIMITGNAPIFPDSPFSMVRTLTGNIAIEMGYASGQHQQALFATGIVLLIFIMILNGIVNLSSGRVGNRR